MTGIRLEKSSSVVGSLDAAAILETTGEKSKEEEEEEVQPHRVEVARQNLPANLVLKRESVENKASESHGRVKPAATIRSKHGAHPASRRPPK